MEAEEAEFGVLLHFEQIAVLEVFKSLACEKGP